MSRRVVLPVIVTLGMLALTGCTASPGAAPAPEPSTSVIVGSSSTPAPEPSPSPSLVPTTPPTVELPRTAPECAEIVPIDWFREHSYDGFEGPLDAPPFTADRLPGPIAKQLLTEATVLRTCMWGIPQSDAVLYLAVMALDTTRAQALVDAMASSSLYTHRTAYSDPIFSRDFPNGLGSSFAQGFADGYWAVARGTIPEKDSAEFVHMALTAARG